MNNSITYTSELKVKYDVDVFVAGGGPAGIAAAVIAARSGRSVYIAEGTGAFGGAATTMLVPAFMQFGNGVDFLAAGIGKEVRDYLSNNVPENFRGYCPDGIPLETLKLCYDKMICDSGAKFSFFTNIIDTVVSDGHIDYVICASKGSNFAVKAKIYIDCTGDGDLSALAGAEFEKGDPLTGEMMAATLCGLWAGIDWTRVSGNDARELERAFKDGVFTNIDRHLSGMWRISKYTGGSNAGHIYDIDGTDADSLTRGMIEGRRQLLEYRRYYRDYLTGFEDMDLAATGFSIGIRETRRILGDYILNIDDFNSRASFLDEIGRYSYPVDIHAGKNTDEGYKKFLSEHNNLRYKRGESYGIPYRSLTVRGFDNLLVAGRCISTDRYMQSSVRVMPGCYITGQAAGAAAAICSAQANPNIRNIDVHELQKILVGFGAFLPNFEK